MNSSKGADAVTLMNETGYDFATLGNHEFDYGYDVLQSNMKAAKFKILCADISKDGELLCDANEIYTTKSGMKIGFFGMGTPETISKAAPNAIAGIDFLSNIDGKSDLYDCAGNQVESLKKEGAELVVAITHLGVDESSATDGHRSEDLYQHTDGIDFLLDGHSHTVMTEGENGEPIQSTGTKFENIGVVVIDNAEKKIEEHYLVPTEKLSKAEAVEEKATEIIQRIDKEYSAIFAESDVVLEGAGNIGRVRETNLGDLCTDAIAWKICKDEANLKVDTEHVVALINGGAIRADIGMGNVSKKDVLSAFPFNNTVSVVYTTGKNLLEILEVSTAHTPESMEGYPQSYGVKFTIDTTKEFSKGVLYENSVEYAPAKINRVTIESIQGKPFDEEALYAVITNDYCASGGGTYYLLGKETDCYDTGLVFSDVVMEYIGEALGGHITESQYKEVRGDHTIITEPEPSAEPSPVVSAQPSAEPSPAVSAQPSAEPSPAVSAQPSAEPSPVVSAKPAEPSPTQAEKTTAKNTCKAITAAKKKYSIKKGKVKKITFQIKTADNTRKTTDQVTVKASKKKIIKVVSKKLSVKKLVVNIKGLKKGNTKLYVTAGKKKTSVQIRVA